MDAYVRHGEDAIQGLPGHSDRCGHLFEGEVQFQSNPIQLPDLGQHDAKLNLALRKVNKKTRIILREAKCDLALTSPPMGEPDLGWLRTAFRRLRDQAGSDSAMSTALGLKSSNHIPEMLSEDPPIPQVHTCLRLAVALGEHPSVAMVAAGYGDLVPLLQAVYGSEPAIADPAPVLDTYARTLLAVVAKLTDIEREEVRNFAAFVAIRREARSAKPQQKTRKGGAAPARRIARKRAV